MKLIDRMMLRRHKYMLVATIFCVLIIVKLTFYAENPHKHPIEGFRRPIGGSQTPCKHPKLELNDSVLAQFFHAVPPLQCSQEDDWVCIQPGSFKVGLCRSNKRWQSTPNPASVTCMYKFMKRSSENSNHEVHRATVDGMQDIDVVTDFFHVSCQDKDHPDNLIWHNMMAGISHQPHIFKRTFAPNSDMLGLNVLIVGFDSLSRLTFMRKLPNTYRYIVDNLNATVLVGYNIVGDGTPQALIPILTGKTEPELPETRRRKLFKANYVNVYPFIWNDFQEAGYVTGYAEDSTTYGAFTYRLKGFDQQPTDHYMRPFYVEVDKVIDEHKPLCLAGNARHKVWLNWLEHFYDVYATNPKFMFGFHGELSHDDFNKVGMADLDILDFLKSMKQKGHLDNTLLIIMSDHGHRFSAIRQLPQGKQEERLPYFSVVLPEWFKTKHPKAWRNLRANAERLTSPFDIHSTLRDVLHFQGDSGQPGVHDRSISLFNEIPEYRTCSDAGIEPHWCTCLNWGMVSTDDPIIQMGTDVLLLFINNLTAPKRDLCHELHLNNIIRAERYAPLTALLQYKQNWDFDGFEGDFSDSTSVTEELYQIQISTSPGGALYEATVHYIVAKEKFLVNSESVSRINAYANKSLCIEDRGETDLRKFCCCRTSCF